MNINCKSKQNPSEEHHILKATNLQCQWLALKLTRNRSRLWRASGECPQRKRNYSLRRNDAGSSPFRQTTQLLLIIEIAASENALLAHRIGTTTLETNKNFVPHWPEALRYAKVWKRDVVHSLTLAYARRLFPDSNPWPTSHQGTTLPLHQGSPSRLKQMQHGNWDT